MFLRPALFQIFSGSVRDKSELNIHSTIAVVDGIPKPNEKSADITSTEAKDDQPTKVDSREGISLLLTGVGPRVFQCRHNANRLKFEECGEAENILTIYATAYKRKSSGLNAGYLVPHISSIQLPLANTTFQNGLPASAFSYKWKLVGKDKFELLSTERLKNLRLYWPSTPKLKPGERHLSLSARLFPLTYPRLIESSMGNVIRSISKIPPHHKAELLDSVDEINKESFPASKELEQAINAYVAMKHTEQNSLNVWALIIPRETYESDYHFLDAKTGIKYFSPSSTHQNEQKLEWKWNHGCRENEKLLFTLLQQGAHLHKVTSGGGGWGNRAGLLSLDPEYGFGTMRKAALDETSSSEDGLHSVASPGNFIQFFLRHNDGSDLSKDGDNETGVHYNYRSALGVFEVLSETIDNHVESQSVGDTDNSLPAIDVYESNFGASSAKGVGLSLSQIGNYQKDKRRKISRTMVDVPGSRISIKANGGHAWIPDELKTEDNTNDINIFVKPLEGIFKKMKEQILFKSRIGMLTEQETVAANDENIGSLSENVSASSSDNEANPVPEVARKSDLRVRKRLLAQITRERSIKNQDRKKRDQSQVSQQRDPAQPLRIAYVRERSRKTDETEEQASAKIRETFSNHEKSQASNKQRPAEEGTTKYSKYRKIPTRAPHNAPAYTIHANKQRNETSNPFRFVKTELRAGLKQQDPTSPPQKVDKSDILAGVASFLKGS